MSRPGKRKSFVPALVDNKRKHLEQSLFVAQRGKILLDELKEDVMFRREIVEAMKQFTISFSDSVEQLSFSSVEVMAGGISKSVEKLAQAIFQTSPSSKSKCLPEFTLTPSAAGVLQLLFE